MPLRRCWRSSVFTRSSAPGCQGGSPGLTSGSRWAQRWRCFRGCTRDTASWPGIIGLALASTLVWQRAAIACRGAAVDPDRLGRGMGRLLLDHLRDAESLGALRRLYADGLGQHRCPGVTGLLVDGQFGRSRRRRSSRGRSVGLAQGALRADGGRSRTGCPAGRPHAARALPSDTSTVSGAYRMWWGGASAPARFAVPLVLSLGLPIAVAWTSARSRASRALMLAALSVSVWMTMVCLTADGGRLAYNARDGVALWAAWASPAVDLALALPGVHRGSADRRARPGGRLDCRGRPDVGCPRRPRAPLARRCQHHGHRGASRVRCGSHGRGHGFMARHRRRTRTPLVAGPSASWPSIHGRGVHVARDGRRAEGPTRDRPPRSRGHRRRDQPSRDRSRSESLDLPPVPAGRYAVVVTATGRVTVPLSIRSVTRHIPAATFDVSRPIAEGDPVQFDLTFPVAVASWSVTCPRGREPSRLPSPSVRSGFNRPAGGLQDSASRVVAYGSLLACFMDDGAYAEPGGFWIQPAHDVTIVVGQPDGQSPLRLVVRNVPIANHLEVSAGKWRDAVTLAPGEERVIIAPPPGAARATVLRLRAAHGARPSDFERGSRDHRELGVWVRFEQ